MAYVSINPATDEVVAEYASLSVSEALSLTKSVHQAQREWRKTDDNHRARLLNNAAEQLRAGKEKFAKLMTTEMGKPLSEAEGEVEKCAWVCEYYAEKGAKFLSRQPIPTDASRSYVSFQPLGTVLAVMPWNFPFWQVFRFAAPALIAGNTFILKHAPNVTGCALAIEKIFADAGFPADACRVLCADNEVVAECIADDAVQAVTLTGSTRAGKAVAEQAGRYLKKVVLELGGSDPYIILEDADLSLAAQKCVTSRLLNAGQSCIAAKRFIVVEAVREAFQKEVLTLMSSKTYGNPLAGSFDIGPMARKDLRDELHRHVVESIAKGATCLLGGKVPDGPGSFYPPTLLTDVPEDAPAFKEELFGPVASIITAKDEEHALAMANDSCYGLGGAVFTRDLDRGNRIAEQELQAGCCFVNDFVRSDPRLPFGGIKQSGYGRELSVFGIREFVNVKTVYLA